MFRFEGLEVWQLAIAYGKCCYGIASVFPKCENYGLSDQLRRAAVSVSNNIAEGSAGSTANFKKYIIMAIGSVFETVSIFRIAFGVEYVSFQTREDAYEEAEKLVRKLRNFSKSLSA
jgi:four helix bundle protein